jgi:predicted naringenin-chalcone synthase
MNKPEVKICAVGTAVPQNPISQAAMKDLVLSRTPDDDKLRLLTSKVYEHSAIDTRYSIISDFTSSSDVPSFIPDGAFAHKGPGTAFRNSLFTAASEPLSLEAARNALASLPDFDQESITHIVTASCTGFAAPGVDQYLLRELSLSKTTERYHIGFMGCFAAFPALRTAYALCHTYPLARVLVVCTELCSIHYRHLFDTDTIVSNSLFSDGAAAVIVSADPSVKLQNGFLMKGFSSRILDDTRNEMGWLIGDNGFDMILSAKVPGAIGLHLQSLVDACAEQSGVTTNSIREWAIHPGGRAILDKSAEALGISNDALAYSYNVLRNSGNMSSATILFVLRDMLAAHITGNVFSATFGPGLSAECGMFEAF